MQDLYGRVGVVQVHPVFEELSMPLIPVHLFKREWSEGMKRNFSDCGNRFISILTLIVLLSLVGTVAEATG